MPRSAARRASMRCSGRSERRCGVRAAVSASLERLGAMLWVAEWRRGRPTEKMTVDGAFLKYATNAF